MVLVVVVAVVEGKMSEDTGTCAVTIGYRTYSNKLKRKIEFILLTCVWYINSESD